MRLSLSQHLSVVLTWFTSKMNDNTLIRRDNLRALGFTPSELAERLGKTKQFYGDLMREGSKKSFGESAARRIENGLGLPRGHLDEPRTADRLSKEGKSSVDAADTKVNTESPRQNIPTSAVFTPVNLSSTILLLGSLLARMDARSRRMMGVLLADLADAPDDAQDVADKASGIASKQKAVTSSKSLDAAIQGKEGAFVETAPAQLE